MEFFYDLNSKPKMKMSRDACKHIFDDNNEYILGKGLGIGAAG
jgi:hypothetical protein